MHVTTVTRLLTGIPPHKQVALDVHCTEGYFEQVSALSGIAPTPAPQPYPNPPPYALGGSGGFPVRSLVL